jgi:hypothetical protein
MSDTRPSRPVSSDRAAFWSASQNVPPDAHHLADALHLRAERLVGAGELLEREARPLHDDVVDDRLEGGARLA